MGLYPYQVEYLNNLPKNIIMSASTGTGKGQMSLEHYRRHSYGLRILILAPASKAKTGDWERELEMAGLADIPYTIMSYDKFARNPREHFNDDFVLIADEVHFIKQPTTKRGKATIMGARLAKQFIGLSATPTPNGLKDMVSYAIIWNLVRNKTEFERRFVITDRSRGFPIILGYREEPFLKEFWNTIAKPMERYMESKSIPVDITLTASKLREYNRLKKERVTKEGELLDNSSLLFARLRQLNATDRTDALRNVLDGTDEHAIVFYNYNVEREAILSVLKDYDVDIYEQSGHKSHLPPRDTWAKMKRSVTLAQYQSASAAIELQYASVTVYFSPTYSYSDFHQSKGRTRRVGQGKTPLFYMFRVRGTIDEAVWRAIKEKRDFSIKLFERILE